MTRGGAGSVYLYRPQPEMEPACEGTIECAFAGMTDHVLVLIWLLLMVVVAVGSLVFLPRARSLCERELRRTRAEYDAFDRFIDRARTMTPSADSPGIPIGGQGTLVHRQTASTSGSLESLRDAYEETVMSVPHFEEEYDEPLVDHMREELSDEIAEAVDAEAQLTPPIHRSILDAAVAARDRRATLLEMLDEEAHSLATHERELQEMADGVDEATSPLCSDLTFDELRRQRERLDTDAARIETIVNERQADRTGGRIGAIQAGKSVDLQAYLYHSMEPTYPVLAEATRLLSRINVTLRRVEDELIYRG